MFAAHRKISLAIACCSCAVLLTEVTLTRIFSVTLMYHYAFLVLSITLFGLGAGGIFHFMSDALRKRPQSAAWLALAGGIALPLSLGFILRLPFLPQVFSPVNMTILLVIVILATIPFFLMGLFISLLYILHRNNISSLYSYDLIGAATGCAIAVYLIGALGAPLTPLVATLLLTASSLLTVKQDRNLTFLAGIAAVILLVVALPMTRWLKLDFVKGGIEENLEFEKWNAFSRVAVSRYEDRRVIHIDAGAATEILSNTARRSGLESFAGITGLAYLLRRDSRVLVVGPGGGREVGAALASGNTVTGVEINPIIVNDLMFGRYADFTGQLFASPGVRIVTADARSYLERTKEQYDVIQENAVDTWAAVSGGGLTLSESYLYTVEAFETYFRHLKDDGILTIGRWEFKQPQQMIRIVGLALEAMDRHWPGDYRSRFFLATDSSYEQGGGIPAVVLIKKQAFTDSELQTLRQAAPASGYSVLYEPGMTVPNPYVELVNSKDRREFYDRYTLNIRPPTDDKPFFFFTLKWNDLFSVWNTPEESRKNNAGLFLLAGVGAAMLMLTTLTFLLPMLTRYENGIRASAGLYFLSIGLAFMMIETVLIQRATLFLGHPTYSFPTVLCALLIGAGAGSGLTQRVETPRLKSELSRSAIVLIAAVIVIAAGLSAWLNMGFQLPLSVRIIWISVPLFVFGLVLGRMFPLGLRKLAENEVPWAWALNGSASVLGSIVAVLVAMQFGFSAVLWLSSGLYVITLSSIRRL